MGSKSGPMAATVGTVYVARCWAAAMAWALAAGGWAWLIISGAAATVAFMSFICFMNPIGASCAGVGRVPHHRSLGRDRCRRLEQRLLNLPGLPGTGLGAYAGRDTRQ